MLKEVIKRSGKHVSFREPNIRRAILHANRDVPVLEQASDEDIDAIVKYIREIKQDCVHIEVIQNIIETQLMKQGHYELAKQYILYRYIHGVGREVTKTEKSIMTLIRGKNEEVQNENSNKNAYVNSTQRDLMAGEVSKDIANHVLLPDDIKKADEDCVIHWHDKDYTAQPMINCSLLDIKSILDKGTVMNGVLIESPHTFRVACNVMTQVIASVASNQYGGQSVAIKHLGKYVAISRERIRIKQQEKLDAVGISYTDEQLDRIVNDMLKEEITDGVQTIQYQINTLMTTNGLEAA
jgi:ribonucleoside-triphosphate reductase